MLGTSLRLARGCLHVHWKVPITLYSVCMYIYPMYVNVMCYLFIRRAKALVNQVVEDAGGVVTMPGPGAGLMSMPVSKCVVPHVA